MTTRCIAYGDCNTEGLKDYHEPVWPELVARHLGQRLVNCGHTMSTTRELLRYARAFPPGDYQVAFIQYGLVDSWQVFRGAPYVLYYPDNPFRKIARKLVKKIKKLGRRLHLLQRLGAVEQVPLAEYLGNVSRVMGLAPQTRFVLVATPPNLDEPRNPRIRTYNQALRDLAKQHHNAVVADAYDQLWASRSACLMADGTHLSAEGHRVVAKAVISALTRTPPEQRQR
ncbi:MAG: SGNH/GDSL hydrolase family protein [Marinobacter sp.]|uniref:SGNH/GDSL hydrolase family protein n=1 Tax=Marinobacter sp. TaxID=50741 RepID=UPI003C56DF4A